MRVQSEANVRFERTRYPNRYREASQLAENFWTSGEPYTDRLIELLERLLRMVTWQEALARACGELLEGDWLRHYLDSIRYHDGPSLWPAQRQGIARAPTTSTMGRSEDSNNWPATTTGRSRPWTAPKPTPCGARFSASRCGAPR